MKITIEFETDDDFEPCAYGCEMQCPFGYLDDEHDCVHSYRSYDDYDFTCPVKEAMEKGKRNEG